MARYQERRRREQQCWFRTSALVVLSMIIVRSAVAFDGYGVNASPFTANEEKATEVAIPLLAHAGIRWTRFAFRWSEIEPNRGEFNFKLHDRLVSLARKHGLQVLGVIVRAPSWAGGSNDPASPPKDLAAWRKAAKTLAERYQGSIRHWQIWNEPDIRKFWSGSQEEYIRLLAAAYDGIKEVDAGIQVLSAGLDGRGESYLEGLVKAGLAGFCDIVAFHPYASTPEKVLARTQEFRSIMKRHGVERPLWITEIGWQTGGWPDGPGIARDEQQKAAYLRKVYALLSSHAEAVFWYRSLDRDGMDCSNRKGGRSGLCRRSRRCGS